MSNIIREFDIVDFGAFDGFVENTKIAFTKKHYQKLVCPPEIHIMNKNESKCLRRIQQKTGMNEKEIRDIKKYRIELSNAQKKGITLLNYYSDRDRQRKHILKGITRELKLAKEHPDVQKKYNEELRKRLLHY